MPNRWSASKEVGDWMAKYGESIIGTRGGPWKPSKFMTSTRKDNIVYVHVTSWPGDSITLPAIGKKITASSLLGGGAVKVEQPDPAAAITIAVAPSDRQETDTIVKLELDGQAMEITPIAGVASGSGLIAPTMKATASNIYQNNAAYGQEKAIDGDPDTRWATDEGTHQAWLEVDLGKPMTFDRADIGETYDRVQSFELQYLDGRQWKTFCHGTTIGEQLSTPAFDAITAQHVRLNILDASEGPSINQFQLYAPEEVRDVRKVLPGF